MHHPIHRVTSRRVTRHAALPPRTALAVCVALCVFAVGVDSSAAASPASATAFADAQVLPAGIGAASHAAVGGVGSTPRDLLWAPPTGPPLVLLRPFDLSRGPYAAGHRGVDLRAIAGTPVRAPASGVVTFVGTVVDREVLTVRVDERTLVSLEPIDAVVAVGDAVARGERLGSVATGGHCDGRCVHLGVRVDDRYVNPLRFLMPKPVLLPWRE